MEDDKTDPAFFRSLNEKKAINRYRSRQASRLAIGGYKLSSLVIGGGRTAQSGPWPPGCTAPFEPREVQSAAFPLPEII